MPFISDTASAIKSRFGFVDQTADSAPPSRSTPCILKSASKDFVDMSSAVRSIGVLSDDDEVGSGVGSSSQSFELAEDPSFWKDHNVQVIIRIRPLSSNEISLQGYSKCIKQENCQTITWTGHLESRFTFDLVADEHVSQEKLFKVAGLPMVDNCIGGYNSCMFAYGQTGSGKTHTMLGDIEGGTRRHSVNCGMTPRVFEYLFSRIQKEKEARRDEKLMFTCKCSFLEIYNEQILDLLDPASNNLQIREDIKKGIYVENLKEIEVTSARDVIQQLLQGAANRKVAATNMNRASSRSHSVFTCIIESKWDSQGVTHHRFARLNLVDLAGSERQKSSGAEGERLKEATNINKSLSTLGLVIMNLVNMSNGKSLHVPYRDSKLTFLLQDSLGGNSKTIIIANVSPSSCCSLETLSTLKFAQRAKFIKNNAIVNEDASGDVITMRLQIQQLKKEVSRLRGLVNGGSDNQDTNTLAVSFPGSPGSFKWEGLHGSLSPLTNSKGVSQKKDYEVALIGAFRREKDKDIALQALAAENQAAMQLAKQREDEVQGLKMILRFREVAIKRLEAMVSGKISAEVHLLKEKDDNLKEIEILRTQVDRNQEVTRFAMENLRLKEEIRRLKSFYEEGERVMMNEQIMVLQNKLLEALDWKLMHEADPLTAQNINSAILADVRNEDTLLIPNQEQGTPRESPMKEENEFLRMQAIQNQAELDTLCKKLALCLEEKEMLERHVGDLVANLEAERSSRASEARKQLELPSYSTDVPIMNIGDQMELKTMVDAIAAACQREAEAHDKAINLSKENEELRMKLKVSIDDNNKLIELYERAAAERDYMKINKAETALDGVGAIVLANEKEIEVKKVVENLEHQLVEMHEENDKLMGLYEKAMQEKDELKRVISSFEHGKTESRGEYDCIEKLVSIDEQARDGLCPIDHSPLEMPVGTLSHMEIEPTPAVQMLREDFNVLKSKLERAEAELSDIANSITAFGSLEKLLFEAGKLSREIETVEDEIQVKQQHLESIKLLSSEMEERRGLIHNKLSALKYSLSSFSSSVLYFEQREERARARVQASKSYLDQKKVELSSLEALKDEVESARGKILHSEAEQRKNLECLVSKLEEERRKHENEKVLFSIDDIENIDPTAKNWYFGGKATELLKSEEKKTKLQAEIKLSHERIGVVRGKLEDLTSKSVKLSEKIQVVQSEIQKASKSVEEMEFALLGVIQEKEALLEIEENGKEEIGSMILEYQQCIFEIDLSEAENLILDEELQIKSRRKGDLLTERSRIAEKTTQLLEDSGCQSFFLSEKIEKEVRSVELSLLEARELLEKGNSKLQLSLF